MIASGIPTISAVVKNGKGGVNKDSIPVREDLNGEVTGYLVNGTTVRIVDPTYPGIKRYRKTYNGTTWVLFDIHGIDLVRGQDGWCEMTGHLVTETVTPPPVEADVFEIVNIWTDGGRMFVRIKKIKL